MIKVPTLIIKYVERIDKKSKDYKNSGVRSIYRLVALLYIFPAIFKNLKTISGLRIFFIITLLIIIIAVFRTIRIDLSANIVCFIDAFIKRFSKYISEYNLFRLSKW